MAQRVSFIEGKPVPCVMAPSQVHVLFPNGLAGLRECFGSLAYIFPDTDGTVRLNSGASYTLAPPRDAGSWEVNQNVHHGAPPWTSTREGPNLFGPINSHTREVVQSSSNPKYVHAFSDNTGDKFYELDKLSPLDKNVTGHCIVDFNRDLPCCSPLARAEWRAGKLIQDRVHEYVFLPTVAVRIVDTLEFQRLRSLKQLGTTVFLYPGAMHTRFEHSIGVAHLASAMVRHIGTCQPELNVTQADVLSVTIAGLCHDIGHGPFSHLYEHVVNSLRVSSAPWHHEEMSIRLLRRILSRIDLASYGLTREDARFIELCITGLAPQSPWPMDVGRPSHKRFLVDIVANKRNGIDVDKLDYFLRDSLGCYGRAAVDVHIPRLLSACKVFCFEGEYQICFEEKMAMSLGDIFNVRAKLHKYAYQHRIVKVTDFMVSDALHAADPFFQVLGSNGRRLRISECVEDEEAFCKLGDWILNAIAASDDPQLSKAQSIIQRINERDLYPVVGMAMYARFQNRAASECIHDEIVNLCSGVGENLRLHAALKEALIVTFIAITFGSSDDHNLPDDPINHVTFYNPKNAGIGAFKLPKSRMSPLFSPSEFGERSVLVMLRDSRYCDIVTEAFNRWKTSHERHLGVAVPTNNKRSPASSKRMREPSVSLSEPAFSAAFTAMMGKEVALDENITTGSQGSQPATLTALTATESADGDSASQRFRTST